MSNETELRRAIALGEELLRISDAAGQSLASVNIHTGVEMLRAHVDSLDVAPGGAPGQQLSR